MSETTQKYHVIEYKISTGEWVTLFGDRGRFTTAKRAQAAAKKMTWSTECRIVKVTVVEKREVIAAIPTV